MWEKRTVKRRNNLKRLKTSQTTHSPRRERKIKSKTTVTSLLTLLAFVFLTNCMDTADGYQSDTLASLSLCDIFGSAATGTTEQGCPVYVERITVPGMQKRDINVTQAQIDKIHAEMEEKAVQDIQIFQYVERNGYLKRPEVQQKIMAYIARSYLNESGLEQPVTEEEALAYYNENLDEFTVSERRLGRQIVINFEPSGDNSAQKKTEATAVKEINILYENLTKSDDIMEFARSANRYSHDTATAELGGLMRATAKDGEHLNINPEKALQLFELNRDGEVSRPFKVGNAWVIVQLAARVEGQVRDFDRVTNMIKAKMQMEQRSEMVERITNLD